MTRQELIGLKDHIDPVVTDDFFQRILSELDKKPVWHTPNFSYKGPLTICSECRRIYEITPSSDALVLEGETEPYCEIHALSAMKRRLSKN